MKTMPMGLSRARVFAFLLAVSIAGGSVLFAVPTARAPLTGWSVTPGQYSHPGLLRHPYVYVPGERITFTITGDTAGEQFDALVEVISTGTNLWSQDDVGMPTSLTYTFVYTVPSYDPPVNVSLPDGDDYRIIIGDATFLENGEPFFQRLRVQRFAVQDYELSVEVNRPAYLGGDAVTITWSVNNLKGGSLFQRPDAVPAFGQLWVYDLMGTSLIGSPAVRTFSEPSDTLTFTLPPLADPQFDGIVQVWYNDSTSNPTRFQEEFAYFAVDELGVIANVALAQYVPGGVVSVDVTTTVSFDPANPRLNDPPEPDSTVSITVWEIPAPPLAPIEHTQYRATGLLTDAHGKLTYVFKLDNDPNLNGKNFEVNATATRNIFQGQARDGFTVSVAAGITQVLSFDKNEYQAGDTATVTSTVSGAPGATLTYIFEVRDSTTTPCSSVTPFGSLLATNTQAQNAYAFTIPTSFAGQICFRVTVDDGQGNRITSAREFNVVFGWLLVNADRQEYNPGETITVSWDLLSNRINRDTATYYYEVRDRDGNLVASGTTGNTRSFQFSVPTDPSAVSSQYAFTVTATQDGRSVNGGVTLSAVKGFFITATFDRSSYAPGDTMRIHYRISQRSADSIPPNTYRITYGLLNGPAGGSMRVFSTASAVGDLTYVVPTGIDEGDQLFEIAESNTGTLALETVTIRGTDPLWFVTAGDIPVIVIVMLLWLIVITLLMWRRGVLGGMGMGAPKAPAAPEAPSKAEPVYAPPGSPMTVTCRSCGSPIEITTSKRPIEVMCPKCGNTEMVS